MTFDGVAHRTVEEVAVDPSLHQVVLGAEVHRHLPDPHLPDPLLQPAREHDHRDVGSGVEDPVEAVEPRCVGQVEVEQEARGRRRRDLAKSLAERRRMAKGARRSTGVSEHLPHEQRLAGVVFDQEHVERTYVPLLRPADGPESGAHGSTMRAGSDTMALVTLIPSVDGPRRPWNERALLTGTCVPTAPGGATGRRSAQPVEVGSPRFESASRTFS